MKFPLGKMSVGDVLDRGLKLLFARLPVFYAINLMVLAPVLVLALAVPFLVDVARPEAAIGGLLALGLAALLCVVVLQPIGTAAILHIIMQEYRGKSASIGDALSFAFTRFGALLGTSILVGVLVVVGFICCIIPGVYLYVSYIFVAQVVVLERLSGGAALGRCQKLIEGHRGRVFGVVLLVLIGGKLVETGVDKGLEAVLPPVKVVAAADGPRPEVSVPNYLINTLAGGLVQILFSTYAAVCTTLLYLDVRIRKEGFDLELAAGGDEGASPRDAEDRW
ncbi:Uncharacterized protein OS=Haliangium ochraceum (strain DSM 14365 / JCM 11303 / SMP-2) GN=Hoch_3130 PE=4 SV=1 [Gemmataceae bacterium]|nr:Uncharacterized protein OS=Haliangium ochraceum (strain DSM 14365 / JCM 11303 / SMP-2) GN=Hoch_3130 PE=4 SV=1 [Gemmataceae bacterium]VTU00964.1 Uncharacterized protein OS=Haliangium ochraceum (strain DSM 14365 / JCM 11303 / SMP-2) GN=Hoch_3130 PE=4 SV=1 [Gemmataceae bacterium]